MSLFAQIDTHITGCLCVYSLCPSLSDSQHHWLTGDAVINRRINSRLTILRGAVKFSEWLLRYTALIRKYRPVTRYWMRPLSDTQHGLFVIGFRYFGCYGSVRVTCCAAEYSVNNTYFQSEVFSRISKGIGERHSAAAMCKSDGYTEQVGGSLFLLL